MAVTPHLVGSHHRTHLPRSCDGSGDPGLTSPRIANSGGAGERGVGDEAAGRPLNPAQVQGLFCPGPSTPSAAAASLNGGDGLIRGGWSDTEAAEPLPYFQWASIPSHQKGPPARVGEVTPRCQPGPSPWRPGPLRAECRAQGHVLSHLGSRGTGTCVGELGCGCFTASPHPHPHISQLKAGAPLTSPGAWGQSLGLPWAPWGMGLEQNLPRGAGVGLSG